MGGNEAILPRKYELKSAHIMPCRSMQWKLDVRDKPALLWAFIGHFQS
jgi:hypothetical protein